MIPVEYGLLHSPRNGEPFTWTRGALGLGYLGECVVWSSFLQNRRSDPPFSTDDYGVPLLAFMDISATKTGHLERSPKIISSWGWIVA